MRFFLLSMSICIIVVLRSYSVALGADVIVGFDRDFAPLSFEDGRGEPTGFEIDIIRAIVYKTKTTIQFKPLTWEMVQLSLSEGSIQIAPGFIITPNTKKLFLLTNKPYYSAVFRVFTKMKDRVANIAWLRGKYVGVKQFSFAEQLLLEMKDMRIKTFKTEVEGIRALYDEQVQGYLGMYETVRWYTKKSLFEGIVASGAVVKYEDVYFAVNKRFAHLIPILENGLKRIQRNGEYNRIYRKWFVTELSKQEEQRLITSAKDVANYALAQYSNKALGCALLTQEGTIYTGVGVESLQVVDSISAVKVAMAEAVKSMETEVRAVALVSPEGVVVEPSASDIRLLRSYSDGILVLVPTATGGFVTKTIGELTPLS